MGVLCLKALLATGILSPAVGVWPILERWIFLFRDFMESQKAKACCHPKSLHKWLSHIRHIVLFVFILATACFTGCFHTATHTHHVSPCDSFALDDSSVKWGLKIQRRPQSVAVSFNAIQLRSFSGSERLCKH